MMTMLCDPCLVVYVDFIYKSKVKLKVYSII